MRPARPSPPAWSPLARRGPSDLRHSEEAEIGELVHGVLEAHCASAPERVRIRGALIRLNAQATLSLAMILHELATNAVKYGALSNEKGYVDLVWTLTNNTPACLALRWSEHDGPTVTPPKRQGFGSRLITRGMAGDVGGHVTLSYEPAGVVCTITGPVEASGRRPSNALPQRDREPSVTKCRCLSWLARPLPSICACRRR